MGTTDTGSQVILHDFETNVDADDFSKRYDQVIPTGIYEGLTPTVASVNDVDITTGVVEIGDGGRNQVRIRFTSSMTLQPTTSQPYILIQWNRQNQEDWYADVVTSASFSGTDIVVCKATFTGSDVTGLDLSERSYPVHDQRTEFTDGLALYSQKIVNAKQVSGTYSVLENDSHLVVDTSGGTATINLDGNPENGLVRFIKDLGNANSNNITVDGNGNNIEGSSSQTINTDYGQLKVMYSDNAGEWLILG